MERLLPYYERELGYLRRHLGDFAERYPKIAGRLLDAGGADGDPHVERLIQAFALQGGRIAKRLDDDYPEFTKALFDVLGPHYLRPFPSCSIARFETGGEGDAVESMPIIARGTLLAARPRQGVACTFRTVYPVALAPLHLADARFTPILQAPDALRPAGALSGIALTFACTEPHASLAALAQRLPRLRLFIDGEASFCAALRDTLFMHAVAAYAEPDHGGRWTRLDAIPVESAGLAEDEALVDFPAHAHIAFRLLAEYFCCPDKFNFVDVDLAALTSAIPAGARTVTLHLALDSGPANGRAEAHATRLLETLSARNLLPGCTPVVNLFPMRGEPILLTHTSASYPVLADARHAGAFEVHTVDAVQLLRQTPRGDTLTPLRPVHALGHGQTPQEHGHYWLLQRDAALAQKSPGFETSIAIADVDFDPAALETCTLHLDLTCSNRDLPVQLPYGQPGGDLFLAAAPGAAGVEAVRLLRKPTPSYRFDAERGNHWRLVSHAALNHLSLGAGGIDALREVLTLYDLPRMASTQRQIGGMRDVELRPATAWLPGNPFACPVRGVQVRLTLDEDAFVGSGLHAFAQIVERYLALTVQANSFTQLVIVSHKTGEALFTCLPRNGDLTLL